jgi:beta-lactamase superfamily II metal-dependent hydrolase
MPPHVTPRQRANLEATIGYRRWAELATGKRTHLTISSGRWQKWCDLQKVRGAVPPLEGPGIPDLDVLILKHEDPD